MQVRTLATITTNTTVDTRVPMQGYRYNPEMVLQVGITGTITVQILGSLDGTTWVELLAASAVDQLSAVAAVPHVRIVTTGVSGGTAVVKAGTTPGRYVG